MTACRNHCPAVCTCTAPRLQNDKTHVSGIQKGTPLYIAPELMITGKASTAADVYSFGVMLWEMYHGVSAWEHAVTTCGTGSVCLGDGRVCVCLGDGRVCPKSAA